MCRWGGIGARAIGVFGRGRRRLFHALREPQDSTLLDLPLCNLQLNLVGPLGFISVVTTSATVFVAATAI